MFLAFTAKFMTVVLWVDFVKVKVKCVAWSWKLMDANQT